MRWLYGVWPLTASMEVKNKYAYVITYHARHLQQIHRSKVFCGMYGFMAKLFQDSTTMSLINKINFSLWSVFEVPLLIVSFSFTDVGPEYKAPPPVATQLVVPTELSDGPVTLTCFHCQEHVTTRTKTGPSTLTWSLCALMCICV